MLLTASFGQIRYLVKRGQGLIRAGVNVIREQVSLGEGGWADQPSGARVSIGLQGVRGSNLTWHDMAVSGRSYDHPRRSLFQSCLPLIELTSFILLDMKFLNCLTFVPIVHIVIKYYT